MASQGISRIKVSNDLKDLINQHRGRADFALRSAVATGETLLKMFDEYVRQELKELKQQISLLESVRHDLRKERLRLSKLETRFNKTYDDLKRTLDLVEKGEIQNISFTSLMMPENNFEEYDKDAESLEISIIIEGFKIIGELEEIRKDVHRWAESYIGDVDDIVNIVQEIDEDDEEPEEK